MAYTKFGPLTVIRGKTAAASRSVPRFSSRAGRGRRWLTAAAAFKF